MDIKLLFKDRSQSNRPPPEDACGDHRVKKVGEFKPEITLQAEQVIFCSVEDLLDIRIAEDLTKRG